MPKKHDSKRARGFRSHDCAQCSMGYVPGKLRTFEPGCSSCAAKLERWEKVKACACQGFDHLASYRAVMEHKPKTTCEDVYREPLDSLLTFFCVDCQAIIRQGVRDGTEPHPTSHPHRLRPRIQLGKLKTRTAKENRGRRKAILENLP